MVVVKMPTSVLVRAATCVLAKAATKVVDRPTMAEVVSAPIWVVLRTRNSLVVSTGLSVAT